MEQKSEEKKGLTNEQRMELIKTNKIQNSDNFREGRGW